MTPSIESSCIVVERHEALTDRCLQRQPVIDARGNLVGLVTRDDAVELLAEELRDLVSLVDRREQRERQVRGRR